jgi:hypothetical protein
MICTTIQRRLLGSEQPDRPPAEVRAHLEGCAECREVQRRLLELEQGIGRLPAPESEMRSAFVLQFLAGASPVRQTPPVLRLREGGRRKLAVAFGLAAGLAFCALGMWAWTSRAPEDPGQSPSARELALRQLQLHQRLEAARTPRERVQRLTELADEVLGDARSDPGDADRLDIMARFYGQLVREHLLTHARALTRAERAALLPAVADRLRWAESEATRLAVDPLNRVVAASFRDIAAAAGDGSRSLLALARGESA